MCHAMLYSGCARLVMISYAMPRHVMVYSMLCLVMLWLIVARCGMLLCTVRRGMLRYVLWYAMFCEGVFG